ncbi:UDP-N-acetylglucosamine 2-epimerase (non-hydrolyzing) [Pelagibacterales bacterium SAG-MED31]|nr:UDP-N-acetylglucosamine 2-epimerase (non-hydrolyzing) [Pelagibacterales bacterium SAG-MED31]
MLMIKIITVVGTRPEIIKLSRIIPKLDQNFEHILVHTGQNYDYELNEIFFEELSIKKPDIYLNCARNTPSKTIGNILIKFEEVCLKIKPNAVLVLGDTNSCLAVLVAKKLKIPIFHLEAGNRCFDERVPEEINRKIIDHTADINLTYTGIAKEYLIREGVDPYTVIKVGSPMKEVISFYSNMVKSSKILKKNKLIKDKYFLVSFHREENVENLNNLKKFVKIIDYLSSFKNMQIVISTHFRTMKKINLLKIKFPENVLLNKPFSFTDYLKLQLNSYIILSDSGTITEEASILNLKAISLRSSHERPEGLEEGTVIFNSLDLETFKQSLRYLGEEKINKSKNRIIKDYDVDNVSDKVVKIIFSYLDYVNNIILKKDRYIDDD